MLTLGLVGVGRMGANYQRIFANDAEVRLDVCDPPRGLKPMYAGHWHGAIIAAPTRLHAGLALPLLQAGLPVLVEKPVAATLDDAAALAAHQRCFVGHIERFNPVATVIPPGLRFAQVERLAPWVDRGIDVDVVLDLMIHDLDLFLARTQGDPVVEVRANGVSVVTNDVDLAHARVQTASGAVGTFTASRVSRKRTRTWRVFGDDRAYVSADLDTRQATVVAWQNGPVETPVSFAESNPLAEQVRAFARAILGGTYGPLATAQEGLAALHLAMQIREAIPLWASRPSTAVGAGA